VGDCPKEDAMVRRLAAAVAALGLTLLLAAPALAVDITNPLPITSDAAAFQGSDTDCAGLNLQPGQVDWHFVLNQSATNDQTLTATFQTAGTVTVSPDKVVDTYVLHYDIITGTDTLLSASTSGDTGNLQLSHICNGGPPPDVPEAPASVLLLLTAGLLGAGFVGWRMRRATTAA
jgi:hypothetical protein